MQFNSLVDVLEYLEIGTTYKIINQKILGESLDDILTLEQALTNNGRHVYLVTRLYYDNRDEIKIVDSGIFNNLHYAKILYNGIIADYEKENQ